MKIAQTIDSVVKAAIVGGVIYALVKWQVIGPQNDNLSDYSEKVCIAAIQSRYDASMVSTYAVKENSNGYTVRASVTMSNGTATKIYCLTNELGGVREITIER